MSKSQSQLKSAIQNLNIKKPYVLKTEAPKFQAPKHSQIEHAQNEVPQIKDAQNEGAQIEHAQNDHPKIREPKAGFFMLAHSAFDDEELRKLSGDAFRLFIWMSSKAWRYEQSNGEFRAAVEYISLCSGCSRSTVSRALKDLKEAKLIECVEVNYKRGNVWRVSSRASGRGISEPKEHGQSEDAQIEHPQNDHGACSKRARSMVNLTMEHSQNDHHLITLNKINNNSEEAPGPSPDIETLWDNFRKAIPNQRDQDAELDRFLKDLPFASKNKFGRNMAVIAWSESSAGR